MQGGTRVGMCVQPHQFVALPPPSSLPAPACLILVCLWVAAMPLGWRRLFPHLPTPKHFATGLMVAGILLVFSWWAINSREKTATAGRKALHLYNHLMVWQLIDDSSWIVPCLVCASAVHTYDHTGAQIQSGSMDTDSCLQHTTTLTGIATMACKLHGPQCMPNLP